MSKPYSIVVLISGSGSNLQAIINQIKSGEIKAEISAVISNRPNAYGLERAQKENIPTRLLDHTQYKDRETFDKELSKIIDAFQPDLIILAGFMRILSDYFVNHYQHRLINIHPSLLPKYKGLNTHDRALIDYKKGLIKEHGASVHFVIPELDAGNVIVHGVVPIISNDDTNSLATRVHKVEHIIYPLAIKWLADGHLKNSHGKLILNGIALKNPEKVTLTTLNRL